MDVVARPDTFRGRNGDGSSADVAGADLNRQNRVSELPSADRVPRLTSLNIGDRTPRASFDESTAWVDPTEAGERKVVLTPKTAEQTPAESPQPLDSPAPTTLVDNEARKPESDQQSNASAELRDATPEATVEKTAQANRPATASPMTEAETLPQPAAASGAGTKRVAVKPKQPVVMLAQNRLGASAGSRKSSTSEPAAAKAAAPVESTTASASGEQWKSILTKPTKPTVGVAIATDKPVVGYRVSDLRGDDRR